MIKTVETSTLLPGSACPVCESPVMAARNPFYGIDLAVHQYVRNCVECSWYDFAGEATPASASVVEKHHGSKLHGFLTRLSAAVDVLKAA